jgi:hypothetical protein
MSNCKYCGKPAGFLKSEHEECSQQHKEGIRSLFVATRETALGNRDRKTFPSLITTLATNCFLSPEEIRQAHIKGFIDAVDKSLEDGIITEEEEHSLGFYKEQFSLTQDELGDSFYRLAKAVIIRDVLEGKIPNRLNLQQPLPINLQKNETPVWIFNNSVYYEPRTKTIRYVGVSQGVSIKVMKGVYYRVGGFTGNPVQKQEYVHSERGSIVVTNKMIYFYGQTMKFRIPYRKILTFTPYSDGIGIQQDSPSAKPQTFVTGDGWFIYNLVTNLAKL